MSVLAIAIDRCPSGPAGWPAGPSVLLRAWWAMAAAAQAAPDDLPARAEAASAAADWPDIEAALTGDGEAYARLVRRHQRRIAAYMWRFTRDRQAWEELVHDVFVEAYLGLAGYRGRAPLEHWLRKIATRVGYRWWKARARRQAEAPGRLGEPGADRPDGADATAAREAGEAVHVLLGRMSPRDRLVLTLIYLEGCSVEETSQLTGWSRVMVKVQAHRARKRLAELCRKAEVGP